MDDKTNTDERFYAVEGKPFPAYNPFAKPPCHPIPPVNTNFSGINLGGLNVIPILLYIPDTPFYVERWQNAQKHFKESGIENLIEIPGTHGRTAGLQTDHTYDGDSPGNGYKISTGYVSEWLNVYMLYNIMRVLPGEHFLKLECDSSFIKDWKYHFERNIQYVPKDFDILWIGSCCLQDKLKKHLGGDVYLIDEETQYPNCGQGYIIRKGCLDYVIGSQRDCYVQSDISLAKHTLPKLKCVAMFPHLVNQFGNNLPL